MLRKRTTQDDPKGSNESSLPSKQDKSTKGKRSVVLTIGLVVFFVLYIVIPFSVYLSPTVRRHAVFLNYVSLSRQKNLSRPEESGLTCTRNFYINTGDGVRVGAWHIPPQSIIPKCKGGLVPIDEEFDDDRPVFLYLHGNAGTRSGNHRVQLYKILSEKVDAHILAFDYRGFGDSTNVSPTEAGLVQDTIRVFTWLREKVAANRIYIWGHSLGTGVGVAFVKHLMLTTGSKPGALILEAPFTKIIEAAKFHPLSIFHRYMPFFETLIARPIGDEDTGFDSLSRVSHIQCPLMILHAEDDGFVPFEHGQKLYEEALIARKSLGPHETQFVGFEGKHDLGHKDIYKSPDLPNIIKNFIKDISPKLT